MIWMVSMFISGKIPSRNGWWTGVPPFQETPVWLSNFNWSLSFGDDQNSFGTKFCYPPVHGKGGKGKEMFIPTNIVYKGFNPYPHPYFHWIGLWENLQEAPYLMVKIWFPVEFPSIQWLLGTKWTMNCGRVLLDPIGTSYLEARSTFTSDIGLER